MSRRRTGFVTNGRVASMSGLIRYRSARDRPVIGGNSPMPELGRRILVGGVVMLAQIGLARPVAAQNYPYLFTLGAGDGSSGSDNAHLASPSAVAVDAAKGN